jgi:plastocyanin
MIVTRRHVIGAGGGILAALAVVRPTLASAGTIEVTMRGKKDGSIVWFDPVGIHVLPGQTIRWTNRDPGNSHTVTAYHPAIADRPRRIPAQATPWNSDYLLPGEGFSLTLTEAGVYDYYCVPHEHAGMVGRIVVGSPPAAEPVADAIDGALTPLPEAALKGFPQVEEIMARRFVRHR